MNKKPHPYFWFFQATKPIECMQKRIGERHASTMDAASEILRVYRHEILNIMPFLDVLFPNCRPMDFFLLCWNKMEVSKWKFYIYRCFSLIMFIFYMYDFSTVFTFIFIVTVL